MLFRVTLVSMNVLGCFLHSSHNADAKYLRSIRTARHNEIQGNKKKEKNTQSRDMDTTKGNLSIKGKQSFDRSFDIAQSSLIISESFDREISKDHPVATETENVVIGNGFFLEENNTEEWNRRLEKEIVSRKTERSEENNNDTKVSNGSISSPTQRSVDIMHSSLIESISSDSRTSKEINDAILSDGHFLEDNVSEEWNRN